MTPGRAGVEGDRYARYPHRQLRVTVGGNGTGLLGQAEALVVVVGDYPRDCKVVHELGEEVRGRG